MRLPGGISSDRSNAWLHHAFDLRNQAKRPLHGEQANFCVRKHFVKSLSTCERGSSKRHDVVNQRDLCRFYDLAFDVQAREARLHKRPLTR